MSFRTKCAILSLAILAGFSAIWTPITTQARSKFGQTPIAPLQNNGSILAILGGYRSILADVVWIKAQVEWQNRDLSACLSDLELACSLDPSMTTFRSLGASIIAYDTPHWIMEKLPHPPTKDEEIGIRRRQAKLAQRFLDRGIALTPKKPRLWISKGQIYVSALTDWENAEKCYTKAAELYGEDCPVYIARIRAALLARLAKFSEAAKVLEELYSKLDDTSPIKKDIGEQIRKAKKWQAEMDAGAKPNTKDKNLF